MRTYKIPDTPVGERLDEIAVMTRKLKAVEHEWPAQEDIDWLRAAFVENWNPDYPQPYIGTGPEDAMLSVYWLTVNETVTLEVDTVSKTGYLCRSSKKSVGEVELAEDIDLTGWDAWRQIASELGVPIDRNGEVLATGMGQSVPERGNTRYGIPAQNKPATARTISGRPRLGRRSKSRRLARYARRATLKSGIAATSGSYRLYRSRIGSGRRHAGVRARAA